MTITTFPDTTIRPAARPVPTEFRDSRVPTLWEKWMADRRRRRYLTEKRRHDARDRSDRYLDGPDDEHQRQALTAFVAR
ncbi:hypothetical protein ACI797_11155 [Geodermatophilus sp. SYSU D00691]